MQQLNVYKVVFRGVVGVLLDFIADATEEDAVPDDVCVRLDGDRDSEVDDSVARPSQVGGRFRAYEVSSDRTAPAPAARTG